MIKKVTIIVTILILISTPAIAAVIDFEGLPCTHTTAGDVIPDTGSVITDNFMSAGVIFGSAASAGVAVVQDSLAPSSGSNSVAGLNTSGKIPGTLHGGCTGDIYFSFVIPGTRSPSVTDYVSFTIGDSGGDSDLFEIRSYDLDNNLIDIRNVSNTSRFPVTISKTGISRVEIDFTGEYGYSLDDLSFSSPIVPNILPTINASVKNITSTSADIVLTLDDGGEKCDISFYFYTKYGNSVQGILHSKNSGSFTIPLEGLIPNTIYYCEVVAGNSKGSALDDLEYFSTQALPVPVPGFPDPDTLLIQNFVKQLLTDPNNPHANQGLLTYVEKAGNLNEIDTNDVFYIAPENSSSKIVSLIRIAGSNGKIIGYNVLSKDYRPFPTDSNDPNSDVLIELSFYSPDENESDISSENCLQFWIADNNSFNEKPLTIQQISTDPNIEYPAWDIRNIISNNNRRLPLDYIATDPNQASSDSNITINIIEWNIPYAWFVLSTSREIIDINDDRIIDLNDYSLLLADLGKEGILKSDIAGMRNNIIVLGIPDGKVDETDEKTFIAEYNRRHPDCPILPEGMLAHWRFDEGSGLVAEDSAGDYDGTIIGAAWADGKVNACLMFDGDDCVDCGSFNELCPDDFTISFWMRAEVTADHQYILGKTDNINEEAEYAIYTYDTDKLYFDCRESNISVNSQTSIQTSEWIHVAVTRNGTEASIYINGNFDASETYSGTSILSGQNLKIGAINTGEGTCVYFKGFLDDVRIYDSALSQDRILEIFEESP